MYKNWTRAEIRQAESDAKIFAEVGLSWLSGICTRKANRLKAASSRPIRKKHKQCYEQGNLFT